jgi:glycosyltransferase involved in cell wall biosynthesis
VHIYLVVHRFPPESMGGTELYTLRLAQGLAASGYQVSILAATPGQGAEITLRQEEYLGLRVWRLGIGWPVGANPVREEYDNARVAAFLRACWAEQRPDLLHITHLGYFSTATLAVAQELGVPCMVTLTDFWPVCPASRLLRSDGSLCQGPTEIGRCVRCLVHLGQRGASYTRLSQGIPLSIWALLARCTHWPLLRTLPTMRWLSALADRPRFIRERLLQAGAIVCLGQFQSRVLCGNGYPSTQLSICPHGIASPRSLRRATPLAEGPRLRFGFIGPLSRHKGADLPWRAFACLGAQPPAQLIYWGSLPSTSDTDPFSARLLARIRSTPGVEHRGPYENDQVRHVLEQIDVLLVPSLWYENTPTVIYEALASGTPVIASDLGGMRELVHAYQGGWLFPRGDVGALSGYMRQLAEQPTMVRQMGAGIRPVPSFAAHMQEIETFYRRLAGRDSGDVALLPG